MNPAGSTIAGIISGDFDRVPDANDTFLDLVGYTREDLLTGRLVWPDFTPKEYIPLDELAHEEGLRFGACTPFEKELAHQGTHRRTGGFHLRDLSFHGYGLLVLPDGEREVDDVLTADG